MVYEDPEEAAEQIDSQINKEISTLEKAQTTLDKTAKAVAPLPDPMDRVSEKLTDFVTDALSVAKKDWDFNQKIQDVILSRINEFNPGQLITLFSNMNVNNNDRLSKLIGPFAQASIAKRQAEAAAAAAATAPAAGGFDPNKEGVLVPKGVERGLHALNAFLEEAGYNDKGELTNSPAARHGDVVPTTPETPITPGPNADPNAMVGKPRILDPEDERRAEEEEERQAALERDSH